MKRYFYIFCFIVLGVILQQIVHSVLEMLYIGLLTSDYGTFGLGLPWSAWLMIHHVYGLVLLMAGIVWGYWMGKKCWVWVYIEKRHWRRK